MIEQMISGNARPPTPVGDVLFLYDPASNTDLITGAVCGTLGNGAAADSAVKIDGVNTVKFTASGSYCTILLPTPLNLEALTEWTIEWASRPTSTVNGYLTEMFIDILNTAGYPVGCRWTDGGYGNRLQFNLADWNNLRIWRPAGAHSTVLNKVTRWAMVFRNNRVIVYKDGVAQQLENGTAAGGTTQGYIDKTQAFQTFRKIYLGYYNGVNQAWLGNFGRLRISAFARYLANYTPEPF